MLSHAALAALLLRYAYPRIDAARRRALMGWWSAKLLRILNVEAHVSGGMPPGSAVMIAANHVSWLDIFLIASVRPTRFIAKGEVRDWPIAGWIADKAGTLFIRREQWRDTARITERVHQALAEGDCVGLFPEGFTTEGDTLLKFHAALFAPAVANDALVQPAAIRYERPDGTLCREASFIGERSFMESLGLIIGERRLVARLTLAAPLCTRGLHRRDVARECEKRVASLLDLAPSGNPPRRSPGPPGALP
jgi:1-acyl-sn-glycerol-3-phosphate acyltransferase